MKTVLIILGVAVATITTQAQSVFTIPAEPPEQTAAREGVLVFKGIRATNIALLRDAVARIFPAGIDKQAVVTLWGTNAAALFASADAHIAYMRATLEAAGDVAGLAELDAIIAPIPTPSERQVHEDGTVTLNIPPEE